MSSTRTDSPRQHAPLSHIQSERAHERATVARCGGLNRRNRRLFITIDTLEIDIATLEGHRS